MLRKIAMLELVSRIWPHASGFAGFAAPDRASEKSHSWRIGWRWALGAKATSTRPMRHLFAIELLPNNRHAYDYHYCCMRCHWLFMVDRHGGVVAMEDRNRPLPIDEGTLRVRTFAYGPCDASASTSRSVHDSEPPARVTRIHRGRRLKARFSSAL
jgi:hypothetical protein